MKNIFIELSKDIIEKLNNKSIREITRNVEYPLSIDDDSFANVLDYISTYNTQHIIIYNITFLERIIYIKQEYVSFHGIFSIKYNKVEDLQDILEGLKLDCNFDSIKLIKEENVNNIVNKVMISFIKTIDFCELKGN